MIKLKTADGVVYAVEPFIAKEMQTVQNFIDDDAATTAIPLPNVYSRELGRIIEYCRHHCLFRAAGAAANKDGKGFDAEFVKELGLEELRELTLAANYLNVKNLLDFLTQTIASLIENKSVEFVRKFFGIVNDYTPEEEAKLRQDYGWAFEGVDEDDEI